jgi:hypothetical protein
MQQLDNRAAGTAAAANDEDNLNVPAHVSAYRGRARDRTIRPW